MGQYRPHTGHFWPLDGSILPPHERQRPFLVQCWATTGHRTASQKGLGQSLTRSGAVSAPKRVSGPSQTPGGAQGAPSECNRDRKRPNSARFRTTLVKSWPRLTRKLQPSGCLFLQKRRSWSAMPDRGHAERSVVGWGRVAMHLVTCAQCSPGVRRVRLPRADKVPQRVLGLDFGPLVIPVCGCPAGTPPPTWLT